MTVERIEQGYKDFLIERYPNMDKYTFGLVFTAFQKGLQKGVSLYFNSQHEDAKLDILNDEYKEVK